MKKCKKLNLCFILSYTICLFIYYILLKNKNSSFVLYFFFDYKCNYKRSLLFLSSFKYKLIISKLCFFINFKFAAVLILLLLF